MSSLVISLLVLAGIFTGIAQVVQKSIAKKKLVAQTQTVAILLSSTLLSIPLLFFGDVSLPPTWVMGLILCSIACYTLSVWSGFKAYQVADVSFVAILQRMSIVVTSFLGVWFLHERMSLGLWIGILFIVLSTVVLHIRHKRVHLDDGNYFIILMVLFGGIASVLDKIILGYISAFPYVFLNNLFCFLFALLPFSSLSSLMKRERRDQRMEADFFDQLRQVFSSSWKLILTYGLLQNTAFLLVSLALSQGEVSRVMPVYKSLGLMTPVLLGTLILGEKDHLLQKYIALALSCIGIAALALR